MAECRNRVKGDSTDHIVCTAGPPLKADVTNLNRHDAGSSSARGAKVAIWGQADTWPLWSPPRVLTQDRGRDACKNAPNIDPTAEATQRIDIVKKGWVHSSHET